MSNPPADEIESRLNTFLSSRLGTWPPNRGLELRHCDLRDQPRWDGGVQPFLGIESPVGTVITFSAKIFPCGTALDPREVEDELGGADAHITIPRLFQHPEMHFGRGVFRYLGEFVDLPGIGEWVQTSDPRLPAWLRPFNGGVLVHWAEDGSYAAGVGLKKHNEHGSEISVGTDPAHRGQGLAQKLVACAARHIWDQGAIPLYLHGATNTASARVAEKAGFPDRGWHIIDMG
jgi:GNAT superfamily N-acetyltransferase